jgi:hypothetical protein
MNAVKGAMGDKIPHEYNNYTKNIHNVLHIFIISMLYFMYSILYNNEYITYYLTILVLSC